MLDVDRLLSELTVPEKASLTSGSAVWYTAAVERLGNRRIMVSDGPHGLRVQPVEGDHIGLGGSLPATCFPTASAEACAWDPELLRRIGRALAQEARAWSTRHRAWTVAAGDFLIAVGRHSRDLALTTTVTIEAPGLVAPLTRDSTLQEWLSDPIGRQLIEAEVKNGQSAAALQEDIIDVIGTMPMSTLANFGGMGLDHDALDRMGEAWRQEGGAGRS